MKRQTGTHVIELKTVGELIDALQFVAAERDRWKTQCKEYGEGNESTATGQGADCAAYYCCKADGN
jgi:hypothetical protein